MSVATGTMKHENDMASRIAARLIRSREVDSASGMTMGWWHDGYFD